MLGRLLALMWKELLALLRDPRARIVVVAPPILQLFLFTFAATQEVTNVSLGVLDQDGGRWSTELVSRFAGSPVFTRIVRLQTSDELKAAVDARRVLLAIRMDERFSRDVEAGRPADVQVILDGQRSNASQIAAGYVLRMVDRFNRDLAAGGNSAATVDIVTVRHWFNPNLLARWFIVPSLVGQIGMLVALMVTAMSIARERELGTWDQLLVSPLTPAEILLGKALPALAVGLSEATLMLVLAQALLDVPFRGSYIALYASLAVFVASVLGIGLFISSLCRTQQQAIVGSFTFMAPAMLLSGFVTPIENMPEWLQPLTWWLPIRHFLVVVKGVFLKDMPAHEVLANTWPMAVIMVVTMAAAAWMFRRTLK
jgi:ABC-2 type transport system permease protein